MSKFTMGRFTPPEHLALMVGEESISKEKRINLLKEQIEQYEAFAEMLKAKLQSLEASESE